jgi:hypothetical protein
MFYPLNYSEILVGVQGFEPWTLCSQSRCATGLRYTPIKTGASPRNRTRTTPLQGESTTFMLERRNLTLVRILFQYTY